MIHEYYAYKPSALAYDATTHTLTLSSAYNHETDRVLVTINDNDGYLDGDVSADEVGSDADQTAVVTSMSGSVIASGRVYDESFSALSGPGGMVIEVDQIEIGGKVVGFFSTSPLTPGTAYPVTGTYNVSAPNNTALTYSQVASVPCFASGTLIATQRGEVAVERLSRGDRLLTLDNGYPPVLWTGRFLAGGAALPTTRVTVPAGALGEGRPHRRLTVTGCHRLLVDGAEVALLSGEHEAFAAAGQLAGPWGLSASEAAAGEAFHHVLLPRHEVILANGAWCESLFASAEGLAGLGADAVAEVLALAGEGHKQTARLCLRRHEVARLALCRPRRSALAA